MTEYEPSDLIPRNHQSPLGIVQHRALDENLESADLSQIFVEDDEMHVSTDLKPLSNRLGSGSVSYH